ncbi:MAG: DUF2993 domain-containing protein [Anaerolineae bacterium]|nr:DUF2993 domain-containing protein [Anaerolineae bacterium]MDW8171166.1 hypothetical protein [Anaerolineae bacterium]
MKARLLSVMFAALALFLTVASSSTQSTIAITEDRINQTLRVTNPPRVAVSDVRIDLQPGQAVITLTITPRRGNQTPVNVRATLLPSVANGQVNWTLTNATADGRAASGDTLRVLNSIANAWSAYLRSQLRGNVTAVAVDDSAITYTLATSGTANLGVNIDTGGISLSLSEADLNQGLSIRGVSNLSVDLQPNQVVLSGSHVVGGATYVVQAVFNPSLADGRVSWMLSSLTLDGAPVSAQVNKRLQNAMTRALQNFWNRRAGRATVTALTVDDGAITWAISGR